MGAGESYMRGDRSCNDLTAAMRVLLRNRQVLDGMETGVARLPAPLRQGLHWAARNTREGSRRNIAAHYDLGNDIFKLFLDPTLMYSSAVFEHPDTTLEQASIAKLDRICRRLALKSSDHVLEIGTGWGGFAMYAAGELGCHVTTITISQAQAELTRERVRAAGLEDRVDVQLRDYRDIDGTYDAIVSIEMLEAVGAEYYEAYFEAVDRALRPGGRFSLQVITFPDVAYESQRRGANWIQTYIFPGGLCPSLAVMERSLHRTNLLIRAVTDIGPSYARTLRAWRMRFLDQLDAVRAQGYDERFIRMWEYYLALCEAGFATGVTQDQQLVLEKGRGLDA